MKRAVSYNKIERITNQTAGSPKLYHKIIKLIKQTSTRQKFNQKHSN